MKLYKKSILLFIISGLFAGCFSDFDDNDNSNVKDFVWKGMNYVYLYKDFVFIIASNSKLLDLLTYILNLKLLFPYKIYE